MLWLQDPLKWLSLVVGELGKDWSQKVADVFIAQFELEQAEKNCEEIEEKIKEGTDESIEDALGKLIFRKEQADRLVLGKYRHEIDIKLKYAESIVGPACAGLAKRRLDLARAEFEKRTPEDILTALKMVVEYRKRWRAFIPKAERKTLDSEYNKFEKDIKRWLWDNSDKILEGKK